MPVRGVQAVPVRGEPEAQAARSEPWLREVARDHLPILVVTLLYLVAGQVAARVLGWPVETHTRTVATSVGVTLAWFVAMFVTVYGLVLLVTAVGRSVRRAFAGSPAPPALPRKAVVTPYWLASILATFALYTLFLDTFIAFKRALPAVQPFVWDEPFMHLDRVLHLGWHPWEILQPALGHPSLTDLIDSLYYTWFTAIFLCLVGFSASRDRLLRTRFLLTFWLSWIVLGTVFAYLLSSAGPCYYQEVTGSPGPYAELFEYLGRVDRAHGLIALFVQEKLWENHVFGTGHFLMQGISAMPSVHVALPVLYALAGWRINRIFGLMFTAFAVVTLLGSVHLGWHYAVDGYLSIAIVPVLWWISGRVASSYHRFWDERRAVV